MTLTLGVNEPLGRSLLYVAKNIFQNMRPYDEVTLSETETDNETEIDKIDTVPIGISVSVQCEHLHTILWKSFFYWCRSLLV